jgi:hypothetical protein
MGVQVNNPAAAANAYPEHKSLGDGQFEVKDVDGNTLRLAEQWPV